MQDGGTVISEASIVEGTAPDTLDITLWSTDHSLVTGEATSFSIKAVPISQLQGAPTLLSEAKLKVLFMCSSSPELSLTTQSTQISAKVGDTLNIPLQVSKKPVKDECWTKTTLKVENQSVQPATS